MLPSEPSLTRRRSENDAGLLRAWASRPHAWSWACGRLRARRPRSRGTTTPAAFAQPVPLRFEAQTRQPLSRDRLPVHRAESAPAAARAIPHRRRRRWPRESPAVDAIRQGHHRLVSDRRHEHQRHRAPAHGEVGREHAALGDDRGPVARTRAAVREGPQGRPIKIVDEPVAARPDQGEIARRLDEGRLEPRALRPRSAPAGHRATDAEPEAPP